MRRTFGNVSYYFSSQPEGALNIALFFFPQNVYDRFGLALFGPFQPLSWLLLPLHRHQKLNV